MRNHMSYVRPKNTLQKGDEFNEDCIIIRFTDKGLFNLFLDYLNKSTRDHLYQAGESWGPLSKLLIEKDGVDPEFLTIRFEFTYGVENVIVKFFLETGLQLPACLLYKPRPNYKPVSYFNRLEDLRGAEKINMECNGWASVPTDVIKKLQRGTVYQVVESVIQEAFILITETYTFLIPDIFKVILDYLSEADSVKMVTKVSDSKLSFFEQKVFKDTELVRNELRQLKNKNKEWETLYLDGKALDIEIGTHKKSQKPSLANCSDNTGFQIILDEKGKLVVQDKTKQYENVTDPIKAFSVIRDFNSQLKLIQESKPKKTSTSGVVALEPSASPSQTSSRCGF